MAIRSILLTVSYDGCDYSGWAVQPGFKTIQQTLNDAATSLIGRKTTVHGASRTDAGVHALGQRALIQVDCPIPTENFQKALNDRLPESIAITEVVEKPIGFDVIGDVKAKLYRYTIYTGQTRPVTRIRYCWHYPAKFDIDAMSEAANSFIGEKDFKSFASAGDNRQSSVRTIYQCEVKQEGDWIYIDVEGNGFLYNMVRNVVGTLTDVGRGRIEANKIGEILNACDRTAAGSIAPASGLCLMWIKY
ncbi:MAG: tRNA pseudouridine(38-40) synthase TruA [Phycisphaerae bacterium]|nr:tRNA pseudouridine(38-40) synthase TruA [Phycisphaerae bacterium]